MLILLTRDFLATTLLKEPLASPILLAFALTLPFVSISSVLKGYFAGKLIMDAGLRGFSVGGAQISEKHCGFVINKGNATAKDVTELMDETKKIVMEKFGVALEPEVKRLGQF